MIVYRIITILVGGLFLMQAVNWILDPQSAANGLEMELLEGAGRSTQVGDMTAFFFGLGLDRLMFTPGPSTTDTPRAAASAPIRSPTSRSRLTSHVAGEGEGGG